MQSSPLLALRPILGHDRMGKRGATPKVSGRGGRFFGKATACRAMELDNRTGFPRAGGARLREGPPRSRTERGRSDMPKISKQSSSEKATSTKKKSSTVKVGAEAQLARPVNPVIKEDSKSAA